MASQFVNATHWTKLCIPHKFEGEFVIAHCSSVVEAVLPSHFRKTVSISSKKKNYIPFTALVYFTVTSR